jgi:hypothetical protein
MKRSPYVGHGDVPRPVFLDGMCNDEQAFKIVSIDSAVYAVGETTAAAPRIIPSSDT